MISPGPEYLRATSPATVARELERLAGHPISSAATGEALGVLAELFGSPLSPGVQMAVRATAFDLPPAQVEVQLTGAVRAIRAALG